jgi:hypothetical protein
LEFKLDAVWYAGLRRRNSGSVVRYTIRRIFFWGSSDTVYKANWLRGLNRKIWPRPSF